MTKTLTACTKNYPDVPADFGENALSFEMCLDEARS